MRKLLIGLLPVAMTAAVIGVFGGSSVAHADPTKLPGLVCDQNPSGAHNPLCPNGPPGPPDKICDLPAGLHNPHCPPSEPPPPPPPPCPDHNPHCPPPPPPPPPPHQADPCTAAAGDPGILTQDTLGQTLWDAGLQIPPLTEDPDANGPLSGAVYQAGNGTALEPVTDEVACAVDLLIDERTGFDL